MKTLRVFSMHSSYESGQVGVQLLNVSLRRKQLHDVKVKQVNRCRSRLFQGIQPQKITPIEHSITVKIVEGLCATLQCLVTRL